MPVNAEFVGREYPPGAPYVVSAAKIREFADAVGATDPAHRDPEAARARGYADVIAPPTFAVLLSQQCDAAFYLDPQAGVDLARLVHGEQFFEHHRPLVAGDAVTGRMRVDSVRTVGGHTMVGTSVVLSVGADPVCTTRSTIVIRGEG